MTTDRFGWLRIVAALVALHVAGACASAQGVHGACCLSGSSCQIMSPFECARNGGLYLGNGTNCGGQNCICGPNPCDGACCLQGGGCVNNMSPLECLNVGGTFQGLGTSCNSVTCPVIAACCLTNGTCQMSTSANCASAGGVYQGNGTTCASTRCAAPCPADIAPPGGDAAVAVDDLLAVISNWGPCAGCAADINDSGIVDVNDLLSVISAWGPCP